MQVAVLAGGLATRMLPHTADVPKWLLPVAGRPFAAWQLEWLAANGVTEVVACVGHLADRVRAELGDGAAFGLRLVYSEDLGGPAGTGGALREAAHRGRLAERFGVVYGDSYLPVALPPIWQAFLADPRPALLTVLAWSGPEANTAYRDGSVLRYAKGGSSSGPPLGHIDYGFGAFEREVLDALPPAQVLDLGDVVAQLAEEGRVAGYEVGERFFEIGSPEGWRELDELLSAGGPDR